MIKAKIYLLAAILAIFLPLNTFAQDGRLIRCLPHKSVVESILRSEEVGEEFFFLMSAESGCRDGAISQKGAKGYWQMMKSTASRFGCNDREDLVCSTRAAARYIKSLQRRFKTFEEVIIAYNMGGHNFKKSGATSEAKGLVSTVKRLQAQWDDLNVTSSEE